MDARGTTLYCSFYFNHKYSFKRCQISPSIKQPFHFRKHMHLEVCVLGGRCVQIAFNSPPPPRPEYDSTLSLESSTVLASSHKHTHTAQNTHTQTHRHTQTHTHTHACTHAGTHSLTHSLVFALLIRFDDEAD